MGQNNTPPGNGILSFINQLASNFGVTQPYGNVNPGVEVFSKGVNYGTDFGTKVGTPINLPQGNWRVLETYSGAKNGRIGDSTNRGYGNSVLVQNVDTGEKLRFSHLSKPTVTSGATLNGGLIGYTGATGNVTGPHLDLEYYDANGRLADPKSSAKYNALWQKISNGSQQIPQSVSRTIAQKTQYEAPRKQLLPQSSELPEESAFLEPMLQTKYQCLMILAIMN